ncbi:unnamed protein product [Closterium sp. NIES-54]
MVDPVANAGVADTLEARLADARKRHADGEYGTILLQIVELGIRLQWVTEHPSRLDSPRPVQNKGGVNDEVHSGARVSGNNGTKHRGVIKFDGGDDWSQARVQQSMAAAGSSRADVDGRCRSPLRSGGGLSATMHVTVGGTAPTYGYFKFSPDRITVAPLQGRQDLITWRESMEPQLEVAELKGFVDGTVQIPLVDDVGLHGEFRAAHLLTFMVISRCCSPVVQLALRTCRERLDAGHQAWHFIQSMYQAGEDFQALAAAVQANPMAVLLDSGCSHHLMGTKAVFVDMAPSDGVKHVRGFNEALQPVEGRGTIALQGEAGKRVLIPDVLYIPGVQANLLSTGQLKEGGVQLQGDGDEMLLVAATREVLGRARYNRRVLCTNLHPCSTWSQSTEVVALRTIVSETKSTPDCEETGMIELEMSWKSVLMLCSDRGGEFLGKEFTDFVDGKGIVHNLTRPYTPQQNGMAEREMRTAVESVRTMLLHMGVQHHWWHLALRQAVWVRKCLERSTTPPGTTSYQLLTGKKPDLTLAREWGCMVQFMFPEQQRTGKLVPKARWGLHLGVSPESKGWEVLDLTDNKVVTSVEVIFYETLSLEVLPPPPVLAPPFHVADRPTSTPVSATGDEGSLEALPVAPASGIASGGQGAKLVDQDGKPSTTGEQQTGEPVEKETAAGVLSTVELSKSAEGSKQLVDDLTVDKEGELSAGEESTDSDVVDVPITKP